MLRVDTLNNGTNEIDIACELLRAFLRQKARFRLSLSRARAGDERDLTFYPSYDFFLPGVVLSWL